MAQQLRRRLFGIQGYFGVFCVGLLLICGLIVIGLGYYVLTRNAAQTITRESESITRKVRRETLASIYWQAGPPLDALAQGLLGDADTLEKRLRILPVLRAMLEGFPILHNMFVGYKDGDIFMVSRLDTDKFRWRISAPEGSILVVTTAKGASHPYRVENFFFNKDLKLIGQNRNTADLPSSVSRREWYAEMLQRAGRIETKPILLNGTNLATIEFIQKSRTGEALLGWSILLEDLSNELKRELSIQGAQLVLFQTDGTPIASGRGITTEENGFSRLRALKDFPEPIRKGVELYQKGLRGGSEHTDRNGQKWLLSTGEISLGGDANNFIVMAVPRDEIFKNANEFLYAALLGIAGALLFAAPLIYLAARRISGPLRNLSKQMRRSPRALAEGYKDSGIAEIRNLSEGVVQMRKRLQKILDIMNAIRTGRDFSSLMGYVVKNIVDMGEADGCALVLLKDNKELMERGCIYWKDGKPTVFPVYKKNDEMEKPLAIYNALRNNVITREVLTSADPRAKIPSLAGVFSKLGVDSMEILALPLPDRTGIPIGALALIKRRDKRPNGFSNAQVEFIEAFVHAAAIVLETQNLLDKQRALRDALIHILAGAIDAKSPYTGGHCARVPVIFQMLLKEACNAKEGPLADFDLDADGWEEARIAAWLHDCGKVTTPEYVMDKATKLETLYDRIHEVRTRFEVLKRDAEIAFWRAVYSGADKEAEGRKLEAALRELNDDFAFVAECNKGTETMAKDDLKRLAAIGSRVWTRTLDKRLGVSRGERARLDAADTPPPPVEEPLLTDSPEHIIPRGAKDILPPDNPWGFKVDMPEALYNRGELYNLSIRHGTLTSEERYKINDHITQTIIMLKRLPLPEELARVPEIAGAHHETMEGTGYPRCLKRGEMSWSARMMAVADIFEALTAWDRPYKASKTLSEALKIMDKMRGTGQIDPDVYELFLRSRIPQRYAQKHLKPEQNDLSHGSNKKEEAQLEQDAFAFI